MIHSKVDLNLYRVLKSIFEEGSITAAANRLHITQPAVSHALSRLRQSYQDELFIRQGRKMVATSLVYAIMPKIERALSLLDETLETQTQFDIQQHSQTMYIGCRDVLESLLLPRLMRDLMKNTPNIRLHSRHVPMTNIEKVLTNGELDVVLDVLVPVGKQIARQQIITEKFVLVCRKNHPILEQSITLASYLSFPHTRVTLKDADVDLLDMALAKHGADRKIVLRCEHFFAAVSAVEQSDLIITMPLTFALSLNNQMSIDIHNLPFEVPELAVYMYWHKNYTANPVNRWFRGKLQALASELPSTFHSD